MLSPGRQSELGISLLESLVAMVLLALGVGALAWHQARQLNEGRHTIASATAILLAQDLAERMQFNRAAAASGGYALAWRESPVAADCQHTPCSGATQARADLAQWRAAVAQALPGGDAQVFLASSTPPRVVVVIAWDGPLLPGHTSHVSGCPIQRHCHVADTPI